MNPTIQEQVPTEQNTTLYTESKKRSYLWYGIMGFFAIIFIGIIAYVSIVKLSLSKSNTQLQSAEIQFQSEEKDFTVNFPSPPKRTSSVTQDTKGPISTVTYISSSDDGVAYYIGIDRFGGDYNFARLVEGEGKDKFFGDLILAAAEESKGQVDSKVLDTLPGYPSIDGAYHDDKFVAHHRVFFDGNTMYQIIVTEPKNQTRVDYKKFFDSFKYLSGKSILNNNPTTMNNKNENIAKQIQDDLLSKDESRWKSAISKVTQNPNSIDQMFLYIAALRMYTIGNKEQATFWYYIAQVRTRGYAKNDPDQSNTLALRSSFHDMIGPSINGWAGSDIDAWGELALRAIKYEKTLPYPPKPVYVVDEKAWHDIVDKERVAYEKDFTDSVLNMSSKDKASSIERRKKKGMYVGPWKDRGEPSVSFGGELI